jgi:hypothetical protein
LNDNGQTLAVRVTQSAALHPSPSKSISTNKRPHSLSPCIDTIGVDANAINSIFIFAAALDTDATDSFFVGGAGNWRCLTSASIIPVFIFTTFFYACPADFFIAFFATTIASFISNFIRFTF